ncbi:hypothetical protein [Thalassospira profundimaris]|uniref:hypothetical protein n=1 Tax=Thalassospira profundimaris TaxID=502049 RepID=UPI000DEDCB0E|nr:hypothetical protein [Thalassospira profundimaris]
MSIGANWRQISPGSVPGVAGDVAGNKFAQSNAADQLSDTSEGRSFSEYMFGKDGFEFSDVIDVINPLQHIPGVGMIYRSLTGDELGNGARVVGGGLFGGVFGLAGAAIDAVVDAVTGEDTGAHVMAFVGDSFGGGSGDAGTAIADASENPATPTNVAAFDGTYQGDLVLPWMAGPQTAPSGLASTSAAEQETIVQTAPTTPVDQTILASANTVSNAAAYGIKASDLNLPWGQSAASVQPIANPVLQAQQAVQMQPQSEPQLGQAESASRLPANDPAELAVAMASAGTTNPVSNVKQTIASNSSASDGLRRPTFSNDGGNTVWARAQNGGRLSREANTMAISSEMAEYQARESKRVSGASAKQSSLNGVLDKVNNPGTQDRSNLGGGEPLSAAEMAARFNAALGRDKAQTMAAEAVASSNAVADQGTMTARPVSHSSDTRLNNATNNTANSAAEDAAEMHPLMERASSHIGTEEPVGAWFSQTMMDGLKKYQAMQKQNQPQSTGNAI